MVRQSMYSGCTIWKTSENDNQYGHRMEWRPWLHRPSDDLFDRGRWMFPQKWSVSPCGGRRTRFTLRLGLVSILIDANSSFRRHNDIRQSEHHIFITPEVWLAYCKAHRLEEGRNQLLTIISWWWIRDTINNERRPRRKQWMKNMNMIGTRLT